MTTVSDRETTMRHEVASIRARDVGRMITDHINACGGDCTQEQISEWEKDAWVTWRTLFPTLNSLLIPHGTDDTWSDVQAGEEAG